MARDIGGMIWRTANEHRWKSCGGASAASETGPQTDRRRATVDTLAGALELHVSPHLQAVHRR
jgi:hypothetical protein